MARQGLRRADGRFCGEHPAGASGGGHGLRWRPRHAGLPGHAVLGARWGAGGAGPGLWRMTWRRHSCPMPFGFRANGNSAEVVGQVGNLRRVDNPPEPLVNRPAGAGCQPARRIPSCPTTNAGFPAEREPGGIGLPGPRHVHIKDARQAGSLWEPVLMGTGDFPATRVVDLLRQHDYRGFVSFEWEKRWHAQIPEPEVALPHFMQWMRAALEA